MIISVDYDETYTCDPKAWDEVIASLRRLGHTVYCVTMRHPDLHESLQVCADLNSKVDAIFFTGRKAKKDFMFNQGICVNVWIDDSPFFVLNDAKG